MLTGIFTRVKKGGRIFEKIVISASLDTVHYDKILSKFKRFSDNCGLKIKQNLVSIERKSQWYEMS